MEEFLRVIEASLSSSAEVTIDAEKLKFFTTKVKIWDYAKKFPSNFQKLSFGDRALILKNYYSDMSAKYSLGTGTSFFSYLFIF